MGRCSDDNRIFQNKGDFEELLPETPNRKSFVPTTTPFASTRPSSSTVERESPSIRARVEREGILRDPRTPTRNDADWDHRTATYFHSTLLPPSAIIPTDQPTHQLSKPRSQSLTPSSYAEMHHRSQFLRQPPTPTRSDQQIPLSTPPTTPKLTTLDFDRDSLNPPSNRKYASERQRSKSASYDSTPARRTSTTVRPFLLPSSGSNRAGMTSFISFPDVKSHRSEGISSPTCASRVRVGIHHRASTRQVAVLDGVGKAGVTMTLRAESMGGAGDGIDEMELGWNCIRGIDEEGQAFAEWEITLRKSERGKRSSISSLPPLISPTRRRQSGSISSRTQGGSGSMSSESSSTGPITPRRSLLDAYGGVKGFAGEQERKFASMDSDKVSRSGGCSRSPSSIDLPLPSAYQPPLHPTLQQHTYSLDPPRRRQNSYNRSPSTAIRSSSSTTSLPSPTRTSSLPKLHHPIPITRNKFGQVDLNAINFSIDTDEEELDIGQSTPINRSFRIPPPPIKTTITPPRRLSSSRIPSITSTIPSSSSAMDITHAPSPPKLSAATTARRRSKDKSAPIKFAPINDIQSFRFPTSTIICSTLSELDGIDLQSSIKVRPASSEVDLHLNRFGSSRPFVDKDVFHDHSNDEGEDEMDYRERKMSHWSDSEVETESDCDGDTSWSTLPDEVLSS